MSFRQSTRLSNDQCEENAYDRGNSEIAHYNLNRYRFEHDTSAFNEPGTMLRVADRTFSVDPDNYRLADTSKASKLLQTRPFATMPFMGAGQTSVILPDVHSRLIMGELSTTKMAYNPVSIRERDFFRPIPLIPSIAREIQNPIHIIPRYWTRGGMSTRNQIKSADNSKNYCISRRLM